MKKNKPYKEQEPIAPNVGETVVVYTGNENNSNIVTEGRNDIRRAILAKNYWIGFALV